MVYYRTEETVSSVMNRAPQIRQGVEWRRKMPQGLFGDLGKSLQPCSLGVSEGGDEEKL